MEHNRILVSPHGRLGVIVPTGIATDAVTQVLFKDIIISRKLASLYDFENAKPVFQGVHRSYKFSLVTLTGRDVTSRNTDFAFFMHDTGIRQL